MASAAVPACRPGPALASSPEAQRPAPMRLSKSGGEGEDAFGISPRARETVHAAPARGPRSPCPRARSQLATSSG